MTQTSAIGVGVDVGGSGVRATVFHGAASSAERAARLLEGRSSEELASDAATAAAPVAERIARCLASLAPDTSASPLLLGIATPGAKTEDGRGIARARNLAAAPRLLEELAQRLDEAARTRGDARRLLLPARLASDAVAALLGETVVPGGRLVGVRDALFLGPGSGVAEALLRDGAPQRLADPVAGDPVLAGLALAAPTLAELPPTIADGAFADLEAEASLAGLAAAWRAHAGGERCEVEDAAAAGDAFACAALVRFAGALAAVIELRAPWIAALRSRAGAPPALLVRTRRGTFLSSRAAQELVVPRLFAAAEAAGATLVVPVTPASPHAACAGALELALRARDAEGAR